MKRNTAYRFSNIVIFIPVIILLFFLFHMFFSSRINPTAESPSSTSSQPPQTYSASLINPKPTPTPSPKKTPKPTPSPEDMPKVGDFYFPTNKPLNNSDYLGYYSGDKCYLDKDNLYCSFYWYQQEEEKLYTVYQVDTVNNKIVKTYKYNPQIWESYIEDKNNIHIVPHSTYSHTNEVKLYEEYKKIQREKKIKEGAPDFCQYDYQDYYDMNADMFEDEDEVYDLFDDVCW